MLITTEITLLFIFFFLGSAFVAMIHIKFTIVSSAGSPTTANSLLL